MHPSPFPTPRRRLASVGLLAMALLALATGCGGGVYVELDGPPPEISMTTSVTDAMRGQPVQLAAAVSAANGLDCVSFYRVDFGNSVLLGSVRSTQPRWDTAIPINAGSRVIYFAQACDQAGYCTSSNAQTVFVYP